MRSGGTRGNVAVAGETGLWERDPATPLNFRGNLLGIAFDPTNPARGYAVGRNAVGQGGVLLRYGKTWTEETALPAAGAGRAASPRSRSPARRRSSRIASCRTPANAYVGGLLVNDGSGWQVDAGSGSRGDGAERCPGRSRGCPTAAPRSWCGVEGAQCLYEREAARRALAGDVHAAAGLDRGGAGPVPRKRGAAGDRRPAARPKPTGDSEHHRPGVPADLQAAHPLGGQRAGKRRRAAPDRERLERREPRTEPGRNRRKATSYYDLPYRARPDVAVLVDPTGAQGWAVGGIVNSENRRRLDTADVERYPADGVAPLGVGASSRCRLAPGAATFAIGGDAQCAAPCADRAMRASGPQRVAVRGARARRPGRESWRRAGIPRTPVHASPRATRGPATPPIPFARRARPLRPSLRLRPIPTYAAASPRTSTPAPSRTVRGAVRSGVRRLPPAVGGARRGRAAAEPSALRGHARLPGRLLRAAATRKACAVIVLDDPARDVDQAQHEWLEGQLEEAKAPSEAGDRRRQRRPGRADRGERRRSERLLAALVGENPDGAGDPAHYVASAYFYDSPEENIQEPLTYGGAPTRRFRLGHARLRQLSPTSDAATSTARAASCSARSTSTTANATNDERAGVVAADPRHRRTGAGSHRRDAAAPQHTALFDALARRPRAGSRASEASAIAVRRPTPTSPIPSLAWGGLRERPILPEYERSTSSDTEVGALRRAQHRLEQPPRRRCRTPKANRSPTNGKRASRRRRSRLCSVPTTRARRSSRSARAGCPPRCR